MEERAQLHAALGGLRDEDREVIGARYLLGLSEAETAQALGIPTGTVKSRTARALARLRVALEALDGGPDRWLSSRSTAARTRTSKPPCAGWARRSPGRQPGPASGDGPDLAAVVAPADRDRRRGTVPPPGSRWAWRPARRALVVAVIVLLALAAIAGAATLGLPGVRLILGPAPVSPPPSLEPSRPPASGAASAPLGPVRPPGRRDLGPGADWSAARADLDARGRLPRRLARRIRPSGRRTPLTSIRPRATRWRSCGRRDPDLPATLDPGVGLLLTAVPGRRRQRVLQQGRSAAERPSGPSWSTTELAYWLSGDPHFLFYETAGGSVHDDRRWVGDTLLWADGPITYRLETSLGQDAAIGIAESMPLTAGRARRCASLRRVLRNRWHAFG